MLSERDTRETANLVMIVTKIVWIWAKLKKIKSVLFLCWQLKCLSRKYRTR